MKARSPNFCSRDYESTRSRGMAGARPLPGHYTELKTGKSANPKGIPSSSPGLARRAYPGEDSRQIAQLRRGCGSVASFRRNPVGVGNPFAQFPQGSSFLATLGFGAESRWDSPENRHGLCVMFSSCPCSQIQILNGRFMARSERISALPGHPA